MPEEDFRVGINVVLFRPKAPMHDAGGVHLPPHPMRLQEFIGNDAGAVERLLGRRGHTPQGHLFKGNRLKQIDGTCAEPPFVHPRLTAGEGQHIEAVDGCRLPQDRQGVKVGADQGQRFDRVGQQEGAGPTFCSKDGESLAGVLSELPV